MANLKQQQMHNSVLRAYDALQAQQAREARRRHNLNDRFADRRTASLRPANLDSRMVLRGRERATNGD